MKNIITDEETVGIILFSLVAIAVILLFPKPPPPPPPSPVVPVPPKPPLMERAGAGTRKGIHDFYNGWKKEGEREKKETELIQKEELK